MKLANPRKIFTHILTAVVLFGSSSLAVCAQDTSMSLIAGEHGVIPAPENIHRVLSAGPVPDVFLLSLVPQKLIGLSSLSSENKQKYLPERLRNLPSTGRIVGKGTTAPLERIVELKPDLIVDVGSISETFLSTAQRVSKQTGVPYVIVDGGLDKSAQQLRELGRLLGVPERGEELAVFAEKVLARTHNIARGANGESLARIYTARGADGLETGLPGSIHTEAIDWVGANNVAAPAGEGKVVRVSMEELLMWDPDFILSYSPDFYKKLGTDSLWQRISAVKKHQYYLPPIVPFGWVDGPPSINRLLGTIWLAHVLCPDKLGEEEFERLVFEYFELFYGYRLTKEELKTLWS